MGKRRQQRPPGQKKRAPSGGASSLASLGASVLGAAVAALVGAGAWQALQALVPEPVSTVPFCDFGVDFQTVEELFARTTPCRVRGLETAKINEMIAQWSPSSIMQLGSSELELRVTEGENHTRVLRHCSKRSKESGFENSALSLTWPQTAYDAWAFKKSTLEELFQPKDDYSASFAADVSILEKPHPKGADAAKAIAEAVCPWGCPETIGRSTVVWMESRGLGQQLHYEQQPVLFVHLHGKKTVVASPPSEMVRRGHTFPSVHPNRRQSQLGWSSEDWDRDVAGFSAEGGGAAEIRYNTSTEVVAHLGQGDTLYVPAFWGQQSFAGLDAPVVTLGLELFPAAVAPDARPANRGAWGTILAGPPDGSEPEVRGERQRKATQEAIQMALEGADTPQLKWAGIRQFGASLMQHAFQWADQSMNGDTTGGPGEQTEKTDDEVLALLREWRECRPASAGLLCRPDGRVARRRPALEPAVSWAGDRAENDRRGLRTRLGGSGRRGQEARGDARLGCGLASPGGPTCYRVPRGCGRVGLLGHPDRLGCGPAGGGGLQDARRAARRGAGQLH